MLNMQTCLFCCFEVQVCSLFLPRFFSISFPVITSFLFLLFSSDLLQPHCFLTSYLLPNSLFYMPLLFSQFHSSSISTLLLSYPSAFLLRSSPLSSFLFTSHLPVGPFIHIYIYIYIYIPIYIYSLSTYWLSLIIPRLRS